LQYSELDIHRIVSLPLGLLWVSNPKFNAEDALWELFPGADPSVGYNTVLAIGLIGAGTKQAR
jgi:26S proteasome regulatory subunit N1